MVSANRTLYSISGRPAREWSTLGILERMRVLSPAARITTSGPTGWPGVQHGVTGWIVPPGDPAALARTLQSALADPARLAAMGRAGWQWYEVQRVQEYQALLDLYRF